MTQRTRTNTQEQTHKNKSITYYLYAIVFIQTFNAAVSIGTGSSEWNLISQTRTTFVEKYQNYIDAIIMHFDIPEDSVEAMFDFRSSRERSYFGCPVEDVELHLQYGAPPVINPDGSKYPRHFLLSRRETIFNLTFQTDKQHKQINISSPISGSYYAAAFHPYINPKDEGITQDGLFPVCNSFIDASLYVKQLNLTWIVFDQKVPTVLRPGQAKLFKIYIPGNVFKVILTVDVLLLCKSCKQITIELYPSSNDEMQNATIDNESLTSSFRVLGDDEYFIKINSTMATTKDDNKLPDETSLVYYLKFVEVPDDSNDEKTPKTEIETFYANMSASHMYFTSLTSSVAWKYNEFELHKSISTESFQFTYELDQLPDGSVPVNVTITSLGFSALKFNVRDVLDVGGTLNIALAFMPKVERKGRWIYIKQEPRNHTLVACLRRAGIEVPMWKNKCLHLNHLTTAPILLNSTLTNASFMIPYPEPGNWYLTFKLFCGECEPCDCPRGCSQLLDDCLGPCQAQCDGDCSECQGKCEKEIIHRKSECSSCDCDGNCRRMAIAGCNSSVMFDISSYPCVGDKCGRNGKCVFGVAEGFVYSTCVCTNNYKGWDCLDASNANSQFEIWLELILLVFSNCAFAITVFIAYKRRYYVETLVYASIMFSSTFYHACDAGEHRINFCLLALHVLQFCDFYCAILSIWVTLIAMSYLPSPVPHLLHIGGAIFLGAAVTMDKTSLWVFVVPVTGGVLIVLASWGKRNYDIYRTKDALIKIFPSKTYLTIYLPIGLTVALVALLAFALFQTQSNYKYVHSLWHIMMAFAVVILLPNTDNFIPKPKIQIIPSTDLNHSPSVNNVNHSNSNSLIHNAHNGNE